MTLKELKEVASSHGYVASKVEGEYRIAPRVEDVGREEAEARAYYTDDIDDAIDTIGGGWV